MEKYNIVLSLQYRIVNEKYNFCPIVALIKRN